MPPLVAPCSIFGGSLGRKWTNELLVLETELWSWTHPKVTGKAPPPSTYHSAVAMPDNSIGVLCYRTRVVHQRLTAPRHAVYFGGNDASVSFNDVHVLRVGAASLEKARGSPDKAADKGTAHMRVCQSIPLRRAPADARRR